MIQVSGLSDQSSSLLEGCDYLVLVGEMSRKPQLVSLLRGPGKLQHECVSVGALNIGHLKEHSCRVRILSMCVFDGMSVCDFNVVLSSSSALTSTLEWCRSIIKKTHPFLPKHGSRRGLLKEQKCVLSKLKNKILNNSAA